MPRPSGPGTQQNSPTPFPGLPFLAAMVAPGPTAAAPTSGATLEKVSKSSLKSANRSSQKKCMDRELLGQKGIQYNLNSLAERRQLGLNISKKRTSKGHTTVLKHSFQTLSKSK